MKLIDWILLAAVIALLAFAFWLASRKNGSSCHGCSQSCCEHKNQPKCDKCEHCDP